MLSTGQLRGHRTKVGFFSRAYEGGGFPSFEALDARRRHKATCSESEATVSTLRGQADIVQCLRRTLEC
jgi:hypothetical protein